MDIRTRASVKHVNRSLLQKVETYKSKEVKNQIAADLYLKLTYFCNIKNFFLIVADILDEGLCFLTYLESGPIKDYLNQF